MFSLKPYAFFPSNLYQSKYRIPPPKGPLTHTCMHFCNDHARPRCMFAQTKVSSKSHSEYMLSVLHDILTIYVLQYLRWECLLSVFGLWVVVVKAETRILGSLCVVLWVGTFAGINLRGDKLSQTPLAKVIFHGDKFSRARQNLAKFSVILREWSQKYDFKGANFRELPKNSRKFPPIAYKFVCHALGPRVLRG